MNVDTPVKSELLENIGSFLAHICPQFFKKSSHVNGDAAYYRRKYRNFQELLDSNSELLKIFTDIEIKLKGDVVFGMSYVRSQTTRAVFHALRMVSAFEKLSGRHETILRKCIDNIQTEIKRYDSAESINSGHGNVLMYTDVRANMIDVVGGKSANIGEISFLLPTNVPDGFSVTTNAFRVFFSDCDIWQEIKRLKLGIDIAANESVTVASEDIQAVILKSALPEELQNDLLSQFDVLALRLGVPVDNLRVSVRSSAVGEDGDLSYAGQYLSMLNVPRHGLLSAYKCVVASLYTPRAISYRVQNGIIDEDVAMGVAVLEMVNPEVSGVAYTINPLCSDDNSIHIHASYGLGTSVVDGVTIPDKYIVRQRDFSSYEYVHGNIETMQISTMTHGIVTIPVPPEKTAQPTLSANNVHRLCVALRNIEDHYGYPQDVEWAFDSKDHLYVLQARRLRGSGADITIPKGLPEPLQSECVCAGGEIVFPGIALGQVWIVDDDTDLTNFPSGAVLVSKHSSPKFMIVMDKASAIVCEAGSITGHMASLAREFHVPTILGLAGVTHTLANEQEVTIDAYRGVVMRGHVSAYEPFIVTTTMHMSGTPVYEELKSLALHIVPLHLVDHKAQNFTAFNCTTLHDITRYLHEKSYEEMFQLSDYATGSSGVSARLKAQTGLDLYVIDLGGGLVDGSATRNTVQPSDISSPSFASLISGLILDKQQLSTPRPVQVKGLLSVMGQQMMANPSALGQRFGEKSYAIISDKYINFSSRVGYHYGVLDCYCGNTVNKNYITFSFKGGAADTVKRERRVRAIGLILTNLGFSVEVMGDRVVGRFQKYDATVIEEKLWYMGKLLQFTRQTDMLMVDEASVKSMAECFISGKYVLEGSCPITDK